MSEEKMEPVEEFTELASAIDETGKTISTFSARNVIEIQYHHLTFREIGQSMISMERIITPPSGWRRVSVSVSGWNLSYGHGTYERALVSHMAVTASVTLIGSTLKVIGHALMREPTSAPRRKWQGYVNIQSIFVG